VNEAVLLLILLNFGCLGLVTLRFFRRNTGLNVRWWATAGPHFAVPIAITVAYTLDLSPLVPASSSGVRDLVAVTLSVASIGLMFYAWGTNRIPLALFHQENDAPQHIVTYGAYQRIRHPFYVSYILLHISTLVFFPHLVTLALVCYTVVVLNVTAAGEERRLGASEFGSEYQAYVRRTGRFLPRLAGRSAETTPAPADSPSPT
jgi:protein-S-isoprenylcysteine O-methyltransferase Ste14